VIGGPPCLALDLALNGGDELLIGVANVLIVVTLVVVGGDRDSLGSSLRPSLVTSSTPFCALVGCLGWCPPTAAGGCLPAALDENGPDLLTRGMSGGDITKHLCGIWSVTAELVHQGSVVCAKPECQNDVGVTDLGEFITLFGETLDVVPRQPFRSQGLPGCTYVP
jgi:hypothetical protein